MKSPQEPPQNPNENTEELNFEQELKLVEDSLQSIRERYVQVQRDQQIQARLQKRKDQLQQQLQHHSPTELKAELKQVQAKLDELEITLESRLFAWSSLKEPFWQIIRFGGLGMIIGWFLAFAVINSPKPTPKPSVPTLQNSQP